MRRHLAPHLIVVNCQLGRTRLERLLLLRGLLLQGRM